MNNLVGYIESFDPLENIAVLMEVRVAQKIGDFVTLTFENSLEPDDNFRMNFRGYQLPRRIWDEIQRFDGRDTLMFECEVLREVDPPRFEHFRTYV